MRKLLSLAVLLCLVSCQQPAPKTDTTADLQALKDAASQYHAKVTALSFDEVKSLYASSARVMPPAEKTIQGTEAIGTWLDSFKKVKNAKFVFSEPEVVLAAGGDMGSSFATASLSFEDETGKVISENARDFHVWVKQTDGSWKIETDIWNDFPL